MNESKIKDAFREIASHAGLDINEERSFFNKSTEKLMMQLSGYGVDLKKIFDGKMPSNGYNSEIEFHNINFYSHCKHHFSPIIGKISVSYVPDYWIIGLSRITECVFALTKRLQLQEGLTMEIAQVIFDGVEAKSVTVKISAVHYCMQKTMEHLPEIGTSHTIAR